MRVLQVDSGREWRGGQNQVRLLCRELARDGSQALKLALMQPFDLIICDLRMPRLGGREMFQTLSRMHPAVADRIIFATGDTVRGDTLRFLEELGRPFLQKPFKLDALRRVLAGVEKVGARA